MLSKNSTEAVLSTMERTAVFLADQSRNHAKLLAEALAACSPSSNLVDFILELAQAAAGSIQQAPVLLSIGNYAVSREKWPVALAVFRRALEIAPNNVHVQRKLALVEMNVGMYEASENRLLEILQHNENDEECLLCLGEVYMRTARPAEAIAKIMRGGSNYLSKSAPQCEILGKSYEMLEEWPAADAAFAKAYELNPKRIINLFRRAFVLKNTGKWPEAKNLLIEYFAKEEHPTKEQINACCAAFELHDDVKSLSWVKLSKKAETMYGFLIATRLDSHLQYGDLPNFSNEYAQSVREGNGVVFKNGTVRPGDVSSQHVTVADGMRRTVGQPREYENSLFVFGASNAFGIFVEDAHTIPSFLQSLFNQSECLSRVCVHNLGVNGQPFSFIFLSVIQTELREGDTVVLLLQQPENNFPRNELPYIKAVRQYCGQRNARLECFILPRCYTVANPDAREKHFADRFRRRTKNGLDENGNAFPEKLFKALVGNGCNCTDLSRVFDRPHALGSIFIDGAHYNHRGNSRIAEEIFKTMMKPFAPGIAAGDGSLKKEKRRAVAALMRHALAKYGRQSDIRLWLEGVRAKEFMGKERIGAIVMNCNPFTWGHHYLVSQAMSCVDGLYLFVVEEEKSFFPFKDRLRLVEEGVAEFGNRIKTVPSGKFVISSFSFPGYFSKQQIVGNSSDPTVDILLFGSIIAPELGIAKRFVGEEPICRVTRQYNQMMEFFLPDAGVELEIIQRKEFAGNPISASKVRELLKQNDCAAIQSIVPPATYEYLVGHGYLRL